MNILLRSITVLMATSTLFAQEVLTNDSILKLAKAGLSDEVIVGMIRNEPGNYYITSDAVITLQQNGLSEKVISTMVSRGAAIPPATSRLDALVLSDATPVRLRITRNVSSADARTGDTIDFETLEDIKIGELLVIPRGTIAIGSVTDAEKKRRMARGGKLDVTIDFVRLVNGDKVALRGVREGIGGGHTGAMTGAMVATAFVVWPAAPFFLFMHGKDITIPKGTEITAYVDGDVRLDRVKLTTK